MYCIYVAGRIEMRIDRDEEIVARRVRSDLKSKDE